MSLDTVRVWSTSGSAITAARFVPSVSKMYSLRFVSAPVSGSHTFIFSSFIYTFVMRSVPRSLRSLSIACSTRRKNIHSSSSSSSICVNACGDCSADAAAGIVLLGPPRSSSSSASIRSSCSVSRIDVFGLLSEFSGAPEPGTPALIRIRSTSFSALSSEYSVCKSSPYSLEIAAAMSAILSFLSAISARLSSMRSNQGDMALGSKSSSGTSMYSATSSSSSGITVASGSGS
mmetsp:Transcript_10730/g.14844  ORF Transcript_10730/g.14844 Transcript_10730/m.14844 type:complete len:232 (-) Transcript_10730:4866-5561(-)